MIQRFTWLASALGGTVLATGWAALQPPAEPETVVAAVVRSPGTGSGALPRSSSQGAAPVVSDNLVKNDPARGAEFAAGVAPVRDGSSEGTSPVLAARQDWPTLASVAESAWGPPAMVPLPAPSTPMPPAVPVAPVAPAFPYQWIGGMDDGNGPTVFLASPRRTSVVRPGDTVDGVWRFDNLESDGRPRFTWLPGEQSITLESRR